MSSPVDESTLHDPTTRPSPTVPDDAGDPGDTATVPRQRSAGRVGRPPLTSRRELLEAAIDIGFAGMTVGAVTARCGVKYSTFYRHFAGVEELTEAAVEAVLSSADVPVDGLAWRPHLQQLASTLGSLFVEHPGMAAAVLSLSGSPSRRPPKLDAMVQHAIEVLVDAGLDRRDAELGAGTAVDLVLVGVVGGLAVKGNGSAGLGTTGRIAAAVQLLCDGLAARLDG